MKKKDTINQWVGPPVDFRQWWDSKDHTFGGDATPLSVAGMAWEAAHRKYGHPPASMIEDGYSIDLTPWWRYYAQKFNPFKRRRRMVPMEDVVPLLDAMENIDAQGRPHSQACGCEQCENWDQVCEAYTRFILKHPLP